MGIPRDCARGGTSGVEAERPSLLVVVVVVVVAVVVAAAG